MSKAKKLAQDAIEALAAGEKPYPVIHLCNGDDVCMVYERGTWSPRTDCERPKRARLICPTCEDFIDVMTSLNGQMQCRRCLNWYDDPNAPKPTEVRDGDGC